MKKKIEKLNQELKQYTDRYELIITNKTINLYDHSLNEVVITIKEAKYAEIFINGFILGRSTKG